MFIQQVSQRSRAYELASVLRRVLRCLQTEKAFQKQPTVFLNKKKLQLTTKTVKTPRHVRSVGLGFKTPKEVCLDRHGPHKIIALARERPVSPLNRQAKKQLRAMTDIKAGFDNVSHTEAYCL